MWAFNPDGVGSNIETPQLWIKTCMIINDLILDRCTLYKSVDETTDLWAKIDL